MDTNIITIIKEILDAAGIEYTDLTESELAGQTVYSIHTDLPLQTAGGHHDIIHAIDMLVKKVAEKHSVPSSIDGSSTTPMFLVDINDHRTRQIKDIQAKALIMAERARSFQYDVELSPMSAYERLIVHTTLADAEHIKTESQGEGRSRRVVIRYAS